MKATLAIVLACCVMALPSVSSGAETKPLPYLEYRFVSSDVHFYGKLHKLILDGKVRVKLKGTVGKDIDCLLVITKKQPGIAYVCTTNKNIYSAITSAYYSAAVTNGVALPETTMLVEPLEEVPFDGEGDCKGMVCGNKNEAAKPGTPCVVRIDPTTGNRACFHYIEEDDGVYGDPNHVCVSM